MPYYRIILSKDLAFLLYFILYVIAILPDKLIALLHLLFKACLVHFEYLRQALDVVIELLLEDLLTLLDYVREGVVGLLSDYLRFEEVIFKSLDLNEGFFFGLGETLGIGGDILAPGTI